MERYYQREIECASPAEIRKIQEEKLIKQVRHVWDNVPWETTQGHINLPYGINKIGYHAFEGVQLQALSLPDTVTELCGNPAAGCANLATIEVSSANPKFTVVDGVLYNKRKTTLLAVPACLDISTVTLPASVTAEGAEGTGGTPVRHRPGASGLGFAGKRRGGTGCGSLQEFGNH